jgi:hypothetical protein
LLLPPLRNGRNHRLFAGRQQLGAQVRIEIGRQQRQRRAPIQRDPPGVIMPPQPGIAGQQVPRRDALDGLGGEAVVGAKFLRPPCAAGGAAFA